MEPDVADLYAALENGVLVSDGAMGTMLQQHGLTDGGAPELWNVEHADVVEGILEEYAANGAHLITTNTFGGTRPRLQMHDLQDRCHELNKAGAQVARRVADRHPGVYVMGDVGPLGELMEPMGTMTPDEATTLFAEQMQGLVDGGVDAILIETMSDLGEVEAAVNAAKQVAPQLPIIATFSFDTNLRTMMGVKPAVAVKTLTALGVRVIGANCGRGTDEMLIIATEMAEAREPGTFLITQSNAGLPQLIDGDFQYTGTPAEMGEFAKTMRALGINIVGSCCGSTPAHTKAIRAALS
jgi:5-methyltetrahydrofolate--homocysteine methyltransferase